jgi:predicted O-linked N-acetylglucosamine transferase (SPINDLY family)
MGVPLVTLAGRSHVARVGVSLLSQIGLEELIAPDEDAFVEIAATLAGDRDRLVALRGSLRSRMAASLPCDGARIAREMEGAYRTMWHSYVSGAPA